MAWYEGDTELVVGGTFTKLHLRVVARTAFGQSIHVSGSSFTLGKYNPSEALPLVTTPEEYPVWRTLKPHRAAQGAAHVLVRAVRGGQVRALGARADGAARLPGGARQDGHGRRLRRALAALSLIHI